VACGGLGGFWASILISGQFNQAQFNQAQFNQAQFNQAQFNQ
jgi:hypothetical protein